MLGPVLTGRSYECVLPRIGCVNEVIGLGTLENHLTMKGLRAETNPLTLKNLISH